MVRVDGPRARGARSALRPLARSESGQAVVEFALVAPVFLLLLFGMIEFARALNAYLVLSNVAREGARSAVVADAAITRDSVESLIRSGIGSGWLDGDAAVVTLTGLDGAAGTASRVEIRYPYRLLLLTGLGEGFMNRSTITFTTAVEMRNE